MLHLGETGLMFKIDVNEDDRKFVQSFSCALPVSLKHETQYFSGRQWRVRSVQEVVLWADGGPHGAVRDRRSHAPAGGLGFHRRVLSLPRRRWGVGWKRSRRRPLLLRIRRPSPLVRSAAPASSPARVKEICCPCSVFPEAIHAAYIQIHLFFRNLPWKRWVRMLSKKQNFTRGKNKTLKVRVYFQKIVLLWPVCSKSGILIRNQPQKNKKQNKHTKFMCFLLALTGVCEALASNIKTKKQVLENNWKK